jgi:hypothetical protein
MVRRAAAVYTGFMLAFWTTSDGVVLLGLVTAAVLSTLLTEGMKR